MSYLVVQLLQNLMKGFELEKDNIYVMLEEIVQMNKNTSIQ